MARSRQPFRGRSADEGQRLHKALADAGVGSRRACESLIAENRVTVNGQTVEASPFWVDVQQDRIEVDGHPIPKRRTGRLYVMVHKPKGVLCTHRDPDGRRCVFDLVPHPRRLFCIGRLDADSTGLVLLTDDGDLAQILTHPSYQVAKTYQVTVAGLLEDDQLQKLRDGIWLAGPKGKAAKASAAEVQLLRRDRERSRLRITLTEGRNREIRRMLARLGLKVRRLERKAIGPVRLKGLAPGQWRRLSRSELSSLRSLARRASRTKKAAKKKKLSRRRKG
ncbi:MAG: pseudouridine synthase [Phycisphaeraceae bacterium]|nr:pseudouridine synthase [Phycisphaeraceae bacterium]